MNQIAKPHTGGNPVVPAADLGPRPAFDWVALDRLVVDERYQRRITQGGHKHINGIVRDLSWAKFQPLTVTGPDEAGVFAVIDGQHRLEAARRHPAVAEVPCWIVPPAGVADQASTFVHVNQARIAVTRVNVFWAQLAAGNPDALWLKDICDRAGVTISRVGTGRQQPLTTVALGDILRLRPLGDDVIVLGLGIMAKAYPRVEHAFRGTVITAVVRIVALFQALDMQRLTDVLTAMDIDVQLDKARVFKRTMGGTIEAAFYVMVAKAYNKGLRNPDLLIPEKLEPLGKAKAAAPAALPPPVVPPVEKPVPARDVDQGRNWAFTEHKSVVLDEVGPSRKVKVALPPPAKSAAPPDAAPTPARRPAPAEPTGAPASIPSILAWLREHGVPAEDKGDHFLVAGQRIFTKGSLVAAVNVHRAAAGQSPIRLK